METSENTLASLIAIEGAQWLYQIPRFQREYVWGKYNWTKLLEDIYDNDPGHYMGSIICVHDQNLTPLTPLVYEVVDGQQRLITLSLLLAAIYKKLTILSEGDPSLRLNKDFIIKCDAIAKRLTMKVNSDARKFQWGAVKSGDLTYLLRVQPSTQGKNLEDYQWILCNIGLLSNLNSPKNVGNRRIYKAFDYFQNNIPEALADIYNLYERISALFFIHILERTQSKAFMLFETLNYRGVPLSAIDIIKNKMLATLEFSYGRDPEDSYEDWQKLLDYLPEVRDQDRFLRQFYNAFKLSPEIKSEKVSRAKASNIITIYETLIQKNASFILGDLIDKARIYNQLLEPEKYPLDNLFNSLIELGRIGATPAYTFLLYLFSLPEDSFGETLLKERTVELLCKYYFRRNLTDRPSTRDLDTINIELVDLCHAELSNGNKLRYSLISQAILTGKGCPSPLEKLKEALADNLFYNNESMARYALARLDGIYQHKEYQTNLWERTDKGLNIWTVEHIFPQGRNIPPAWVDVIANGNKDEAEKIQSQWVHCLGNLTLSAYNSKLSNLSFEKKREKVDVTIHGIRYSAGYKNGLALNNIPFAVDGKLLTLASAEQWDVEHIKARNQAMVDILTQHFKFDTE